MKPEVRIFPGRDEGFRGEVDRALAKLDASATNGGQIDPSALIALVRRHYPNVTVTSRDGLGAVGDARLVWYVFRDRRVRADDWRRDRLYEALARARTVVGDSRRAIRKSRAALTDSSNHWLRR